jgi:hypothetical protein
MEKLRGAAGPPPDEKRESLEEKIRIGGSRSHPTSTKPAGPATFAAKLAKAAGVFQVTCSDTNVAAKLDPSVREIGSQGL